MTHAPFILSHARSHAKLNVVTDNNATAVLPAGQLLLPTSLPQNLLDRTVRYPVPLIHEGLTNYVGRALKYSIICMYWLAFLYLLGRVREIVLII